MATEKLNKHMQRRGIIKNQLLRFEQYVESDEIDNAELELRLQKAELLFQKFEDIQTDIESVVEEEQEYRDDFEKVYYSVIAKAKKRLCKVGSAVSEIRLNPIKLPVFSGGFAGWLQFRDTFKSLVDQNQALNDLQKFHYLLSCLAGEALKLIQSIEVCERNYNVAWTILIERYQNERLIINRHINSLCTIPSIKQESFGSIRRLIDEAQVNLRALNALGLPTEHWDMLVIYISAAKLDSNTRGLWETQPTKGKLPTWQEFIEFLGSRARLLETAQPSRAFNKTESPKLNMYVSNYEECLVCKGSHKLVSCKTFSDMPLAKRVELVNAKRLCRNCLGTGHVVRNCFSKVTCRICHAKHHNLLHLENGNKSSFNNRKVYAQQPLVVGHSAKGGAEVILSTAVVGVKLKNGSIFKARAILDNGSMSSFITEELCQRMKLNCKKVNIPIKGIQEKLSHIKKHVDLEVVSLNDNYCTNLNCLVLQTITGTIPRSPVQGIKRPRGIKLADPDFGRPGPIDMLLGADIFWQVLESEMVQFDDQQPIFRKTKLGWLVTGTAPTVGKSPKNEMVCNLSISSLQKDLERFWRIEEVPQEMVSTAEEAQCEKHFKETASRDEKGRFVVNLPFKTGERPELGESLHLATKRLINMEKRFNINSDLKDQYTEFMDKYEEMGHMSLVNSEDGKYYMPHHAVFNKQKIRVVFDGSAKTSLGVSLNDCLLKGPVIQPDLFSLITIFRREEYCVTADIEKMYRMMLVNPKDLNYQRIVWRRNPQEEVKHYTLNTLVYGLKSSPFIATRVLQEIAEGIVSANPLASKVICSNFYMDDFLASFESQDACVSIKQDLVQIFKNAGMNLVKWKSNVPGLSDEEEADKDKSLSLDASETVKILGLRWNYKDDYFYYQVNPSEMSEQDITKRKVLSEIAKLFDPLGLVQAVTVRFKMLMQDLWSLKLGWDEVLPSSIRKTWLSYREDLLNLNKLHIPRKIKLAYSNENLFIGFADASTKAYGGVIYMRSVDCEGNYSISLVASKSRVAPLKEQTLPKLELCAAVLLGRLLTQVRSALRMEGISAILFSDSEIALHWLKGPPAKWDVFVSHRVAEVQGLQDCSWRHIASQSNPADLVSRGISAEQIASCKKWWKGPEFLVQPENLWPKSANRDIKDVPEMKVEVSLVTTETEGWDLFDRFSSYNRLLRVTAYIVRFINNSRNKLLSTYGELTLQELNVAHDKLITAAQNDSFYKEKEALLQGNYVPTKSSLRALNPIIGDGIMRVGGRLENAELSFDERHPILISNQHPLATLLIRYYHLKNLHLGASNLLYQIRTKYWITKCKPLVKRIIRNCIICFRFRPKGCVQLMGQLPKERVAVARPFSVCGIDYCGPFSLKFSALRNAKIVKCYVCVIVCFSTKAVHLELVYDLTKDSLVNVFKRFISRRGAPSRMYSDNAGNFKAMARELKELYAFLEGSQDEIHRLLAQDRVEWVRLPALSPSMNGLAEATVKSFKTIFKKVVLNNVINLDTFWTFLIEIEAILNSRPLTPLSDDPHDLIPLTPAHFIIGTSLKTIPHRSLQTTGSLRSNYRVQEQAVKQFWDSWSTCYLQSLQSRNKWTRENSRKLREGDMVVLHDKDTPPLFWKMGRVSKVYEGADGRVRVVSVQTVTGIKDRHISKLSLLPEDVNIEEV